MKCSVLREINSPMLLRTGSFPGLIGDKLTNNTVNQRKEKREKV
jgi:hypothetical protein